MRAQAADADAATEAKGAGGGLGGRVLVDVGANKGRVTAQLMQVRRSPSRPPLRPPL